MNVNERLTAALGAFGDPVWFGEAMRETGGPMPERYYAFNYTTFGAAHRDNAPGYLRHLIQVHFFCPLNYDSVSRARQTRRALIKAGFTYPSTVNATDGCGRHTVLECEFIEEADDADA